MRKLFPAVVVLLLACNEAEHNNKPDSANTSTPDTISVNDAQLSGREELHNRDSFMVDSFLVLMDSFYSAYSGRKWNVPYRRDSLTSRDTTYHSRRYAFKPVNGSYARWHYFGEMDKVFELAECCYSDSSAANTGWQEFERLSGPAYGSGGKEKDDCIPCLSSGTDLVFRTGNKIFWLSTYCNWEAKDNRTIESLLMRTIVACNPVDKIRCNCFGTKPITH